MSDIERALLWDGVYAQILIYSASPATEAGPEPQFSRLGDDVGRIFRPFELVDGCGRYTEYRFFVHEIRLHKLPDPLDVYLRSCLEEATRTDALFAWLMFEGQFSFDQLLTTAIAEQVYGYRWQAEHSVLALPAEIRAGKDWRTSITAQRERLLKDTRSVANGDEIVSLIRKHIPVEWGYCGARQPNGGPPTPVSIWRYHEERTDRRRVDRISACLVEAVASFDGEFEWVIYSHASGGPPGTNWVLQPLYMKQLMDSGHFRGDIECYAHIRDKEQLFLWRANDDLLRLANHLVSALEALEYLN